MNLKILTFMHDKETYSLEPKDIKLTRLIDELRKETDLEELQDGMEYNAIEERVLARNKILSQSLWDDKFITSDEAGRYCEREIFKDCWENREIYRENCGTAFGSTEESTCTDKTTKPPIIDLSMDDDDDEDGELFAEPALLEEVIARTSIRDKRTQDVCKERMRKVWHY